MTLKTPTFWYRDANTPAPLIERLLCPVASLYNAFFTLHQSTKTPYRADIPVLCIGNLVAGGTGKTPTSLAVLELLQDHALCHAPYFLIRGYGGAEKGPLLVDPNKHTAWDVGDEALILARYAPTIVGGDRATSAQLAQDKGADLLIMDDGLQNPGIYKDIRFVVMNGEMGLGNLKTLPAGPLRQPLEKGLSCADAFIEIGEDMHNTHALLPKNKPFIHAVLKPGPDFKPDKTKAYLAFAGLGYPDKFFKFLKKDIGLNIVREIAFGDHHPYDDNDLLNLAETARSLGAQMITTEKDYMRLPNLVGVDVETVPVKMVWDDASTLVGMIQDKLRARS